MSSLVEAIQPTGETAEPGRPKRVLMIAYACSPQMGSEPGVGWHRAVELARDFEVWVITEEFEFREVIEEHLREHGPIDNLHFHFVPRMITSDSWFWRLYRFRSLYYFAYKIWHRRAYRCARELHERLRFDLIHQSTLCGFREPGLSWKLDAPFLWGPIGGTQSYPWRFLPQAGITGAVKEGARNLLNAVQMRFSTRVRAASRAAARLVMAIPEGQDVFRRIHGVQSVCVLDVGVDGVREQSRAYRNHEGRLRLLWSGYFGHHKALQLLLKAVAALPDDLECELRVLGDGPRKRAWRRLARNLGLEDRCTWLGWLPHAEALKQYDWADVFVFTSLRDTCGMVILEALSRGLPVICLDHQGVGSVVTDRCGIKVPVTSPREVVSGLRDSIATAITDKEMLESLSRGAIDRAQEFRWRVHGQRIGELYRNVLAEH